MRINTWDLVELPKVRKTIRDLMTTFMTLSTISAFLDLELYQMDGKTAFFHESLIEEFYMLQPEGFMIPGKEHLVCKL